MPRYAARLALFAAAASVAVASSEGCSLLTSVDGLSGGADETTDAGPDVSTNEAGADAVTDAPPLDGAMGTDAPPNDAAPNKVGSVYVFGGATDVGEVATVLAADIHADGTLGTWQTVAPLPESRTYAEAVVGQGLVAVVGGGTGGSAVTSTLVAKIGTGGLGDWSALGQFAIPRIRHGAALANDRLYLIGGTDVTDAPITDVQFAPISATSVGPWTTTSSLPVPRSRVAVASTSKFVYVFGGSDTASAPVADVLGAPINMDGSLGTFAAQPALPGARTHAQATLVAPGHILVTGGESVTNSAIVYDIDATLGSLSAPRATLSLPAPTDHHATVVFGNRVYVIGGFRNNGPRLADVLVGDVGSDGTISRWTATTSLPAALAYHTAAAF